MQRLPMGEAKSPGTGAVDLGGGFKWAGSKCGRAHIHANLPRGGCNRDRYRRVLITASPSYEVLVNGTRLGGGHVVNQVRRFDVTSLLADGDNEIRVTVDGGKHTGNVPFGVIAAIATAGGPGPALTVVTDEAWQVMADGRSAKAVEHGGFDAEPWKLTPASLQQASLYPAYRVTLRSLATRGIEPDFEGDGVRAIHRRDGDEDLYFVANRVDREIAVACIFRVSAKQPEWWDALTGERRTLHHFEQKSGRTLVPMRLEPYESGFLVFRNGAGARGAAENFPRVRPY